MAAAGAGNLEVARQLLDAGAEIDARGRDGVTALELAAVQGRGELVEMLLERDADVDVRHDGGGTPLADRRNPVRLLLAVAVSHRR